VDEVLAVGDADFQRKCLDRIEEMRARDTTIFLVTHAAAGVEQLCDRALLLMQGRLRGDGKPAEVIALYEELRKERQPLELGLYNAEFPDYDVPAKMCVGGHYQFAVTVRNRSEALWRAKGPPDAEVVNLGYHWLDRLGGVHQWLGVDTALPRDLGPGEAITVQCAVNAPAPPGPYRLEIDLMRDGHDWFSRHGCPGPQIEVQVLPSDESQPVP
jgi:hypothetical protein